MLQSLGVDPGMSVLDLGTGTGYVTALLAHLTKDPTTITSVDIDPELVRTATGVLAVLGLRPTLIAGNGSALTWPRTFDRVLATYGLPAITCSLHDAVGPFGRLVANVFGPLSFGMAVLERGTDGVLEGRFHTDGVSFMQQRTDPVSYQAQIPDQPDTGEHPVDVPLDVLDHPHFHFLLSAFLPGVNVQYGTRDDTGSPYRTLTLPEGESVTLHHPHRKKPYATGDGPMAARVVASFDAYRDLGEPSWGDFGLTVTRKHHRLWLGSRNNVVTSFATPVFV